MKKIFFVSKMVVSAKEVISTFSLSVKSNDYSLWFDTASLSGVMELGQMEAGGEKEPSLVFTAPSPPFFFPFCLSPSFCPSRYPETSSKSPNALGSL